MLWFGLLTAVPLIIHLYHQRKRIVAKFSTNRFFTKAIIQSQRRMQLQRILLMLLRMAICLAVAFALARPFFLSAGFARSAGKRDVVILLDDSMSMKTAEQGEGPSPSNATHFDRAKAATVALLQEMSKRDRAVIFTYSGKAFGRSGAGGMGLTRKPARLVSDVESLEPAHGAGNAFIAMEHAARVLGSPAQRARMMLMVTDFQAGQWPQSTWPQPKTPVPVTVAKVAEPARNNVWIDYARLGEPVMLPGQPNALEVCVRNGAPDTRQVELVVEVNGKQTERRLFNIQGRGARVEQVPLVVDDDEEKGGEVDALRKRDPYYRVKALIRSPDDPLEDDNSYFVVTRSVDNLPVLLVEGQVAREMRKRSAYYLSTALGSVSEEASIQLHQAPVAEAPWSDLSSYRAVILSGISSLRQDQVDNLKSFVLKGGGLIIFMCQGADPKFYNGMLAEPENDCLLPGRITGLIVRRAETEPMRVREAEWEHEVLRRFKGELRSGLAGIGIRRMYKMEPSRALTLIRVDRRMPLLVEKRYGQGTVMVCTTAPEPEWSDFPLRRNFIVLLNRMTIYAAVGSKQAAAYEVGRDMVVERASKEDESGRVIVRPDGVEVQARRTGMGDGSALLVPAEEVNAPGFYRARAAEGADGPGPVYAVNCPRSESVPRSVDLEEVKRTAGDWTLDLADMGSVAAADIVKGGESVDDLLASGKAAKGMWDSLLWLALLALVAEPVIANRLSGGPIEEDEEEGEGVDTG